MWQEERSQPATIYTGASAYLSRCLRRATSLQVEPPPDKAFREVSTRRRENTLRGRHEICCITQWRKGQLLQPPSLPQERA